MNIKKIVLAIILFPITMTLGLFFVIICMTVRHFAVWQLSDNYKRKHKEYHIYGKFNPIQFVLGTEPGGDKGRAEMWKH